MSHLVDPCLKMTKLVHGIRRGIDSVSPLSGLTAQLRILIQEQKNVLTSTKRATFEKDEAARHLVIWGSNESADIADITAKLAILIQKATNLERTYADRLGESRELFKEIRVAEDSNYDTRKKKLDLQEKLEVAPKEDIQQEMKLLRKETMNVENDLEDMKRKNLKKAALNQLIGLEELGKGLLLIAHYGKEVMKQLDDTPTQAGVHADERFAAYNGAAKTAYAVKSCTESLDKWSTYAPKVEIQPIDLGDFPKDNKEAADAILKDLAVKTNSDWLELQSPPSVSSPSSILSMDKLKRAHEHNSSSTSLGSSPEAVSSSPRNSISSSITTVTYVDGVPAVSVIQEIPPTPDLDDSPAIPKTSILSAPLTATAPATADDGAATDNKGTASTPSEPSKDDSATAAVKPSEDGINKTETEQDTETEEMPPPPPQKDHTASPPPPPKPSPFVPQTTYKPHTTYVPSHPHPSSVSQASSASTSPALSATHTATSPAHTAHVSPGLGAHHHPPAHVPYVQQQQHQQQPYQHHAGDAGRISPTPALPKPRPLSGGQYAPHPLMMQFAPGVNQSAMTNTVPVRPRPHSAQQQSQHTVIPPMYPPLNPNQQHQPLPTQMPLPMQVNMPMPMPMPMPVPIVPQHHTHSPNPQETPSSSASSSSKRHSEPISVSFPGVHSTLASPSPPPPAKSTSPAPGASSTTAPIRRNPQAILPVTQPGFRLPVGFDADDDDAAVTASIHTVGGDASVDYDGPPPDYAETAMQQPAEVLEEKERKK